MTIKGAKLAVLSSFKVERKSAVSGRPYHEVVFALQTTLDADRLMEIFSEHLQLAVPHTGLAFHGADGELMIQIGKSDRHRCAYDLVLEHELLGELTASRGRRFSELELATVEAYLCRLLYPLRNALRYRRALHSAYVDPLTRMRNRGALFGSLQREWELARRHGSALSLIMLDVDHFKAINDAHGHDKGDQVLREVAACISDSVRTCDIVFRYGGEEFLILLSNTANDGAAQLAARIRQNLENLIYTTDDGLDLRVTASLGVATLRDDENKEMLIKRADQAMYQAKRQGRNRIEVADTD